MVPWQVVALLIAYVIVKDVLTWRKSFDCQERIDRASQESHRVATGRGHDNMRYALHIWQQSAQEGYIAAKGAVNGSGDDPDSE